MLAQFIYNNFYYIIINDLINESVFIVIVKCLITLICNFFLMKYLYVEMESKKKDRVFCLDFIRAASMIMIFLFHFSAHYISTFNIQGKYVEYFWLYANGDWGICAVNIFFMISGSSLMMNYKDKIDIGGFYKKRLLRLYPMFWIAYTIVFLERFYVYKNISNIPLYKLLLSIIGMDGYFSYATETFYILGEWFLGAIIFLYILFPLVRLLINKFPPKLILMISFICVILVAYFNPFDPRLDPNHNILVCLFSFIFGMVYFIEINKVSLQKFLICLIGSIILIKIKIDVNSVVMMCIQAVFIYNVFAYISYLVEKYIKNIKGLFISLSKYSYAIFLTHHVILIWILEKFSNKILSIFETLCLLSLCFGITIIFSILLFYLEKIIIDYIKNLRYY